MRKNSGVGSIYRDNAIGKVTGNEISGNVGNIIAGIGNIQDNGLVNKKIESSEISNEEWNELVRFFCEKQLSLNEIDKEYNEQYEEAERIAKRHDKAGLKQFFKEKGTAFLNIVLGAGVQVGIKEIIDRIIN